ncbi:uncharacterized protein CC84DRAFT_1202535 [Paraphaeosphaeria sporulosa]|uniref:Uncharacterized protein n=1 Tax=Paraphaeosphaeria sporulosa TaxID=1460663 RepID=A0A177CRP9_9PLEO|nr:uncharacterized protein CC84DRAFT_1202535 [Paraphaeosphaeria sporulosa]OAG09966.1 hypothetical protein CC84DRAFT_1202535 [Paraphaeosphaeria sporulosa]
MTADRQCSYVHMLEGDEGHDNDTDAGRARGKQWRSAGPWTAQISTARDKTRARSSLQHSSPAQAPAFAGCEVSRCALPQRPNRKQASGAGTPSWVSLAAAAARLRYTSRPDTGPLASNRSVSLALCRCAFPTLPLLLHLLRCGARRGRPCGRGSARDDGTAAQRHLGCPSLLGGVEMRPSVCRSTQALCARGGSARIAAKSLGRPELGQMRN